MSTGIAIRTIVQDEGTNVPANDVINFTGAGVSVSNIGGAAQVNIPGVGSTSNYGLYTQTSSSIPVTGTVAELSLLDGGIGSKTVPANGFNVGDSFKAILVGHIASANNQTLRIRLKAGTILLADTGLMTMPATSGNHWKIEIDFTIRAIGGVGVASIVSGGSFTYTKSASSAFEGVGFSSINSTTFNTTISNELFVTAQWGSTNATNSIYSELFVLTKTF
jgi:hypothetical protein